MHKAVIYTVVKVGGDTGQGPATEVIHLRLNQPPVFSSVFSKKELEMQHIELIYKLHISGVCNVRVR